MNEPLKSAVHKSLTYLLPLAAAVALAYYFGGARLAGGVAAGGALGYLNFELLTRGVEGFFGGANGVRGVMVFLSFLRLGIMFVLITALVYFHLVSVFGLLIGFTVVFTVNIFHGLKLAREM